MSQPPHDGSDPSVGSGPPEEGPEGSEQGQPSQGQPGHGQPRPGQPELGQPGQPQPGHGQPGQFGGYPGQYGQPSAAAPGEQPGQFGGHPGQYGPTSQGPAAYGQPNYQYAQPATGGGPLSPGDGPPTSSDKTSLVTVVVILAALILIGAGVVIYLLSNGDDDGGASGSGPAPLVDTTGAPTPDLPTDVPTAELPTIDVPTIDVPTIEFPTDEIPTDFPTDDLPTDEFPTDLPSLPTDGGPGEQAYLQVARGFVKAAAAGDCAAARAFGSDSFNEVYDDASVCAGATRAALRDDDLAKYETTVYGAYVASVEFDDGQTLIAMVVEDGKTPLVQSVLAYDF